MEHAEEILRRAGCPKINLQVRSENKQPADFMLRRSTIFFETFAAFCSKLLWNLLFSRPVPTPNSEQPDLLTLKMSVANFGV